MRSLIPAFLLLGLAVPAFGQSAEELAAYKLGYAAGYEKCRMTPGCSPYPGPGGAGGWNSTGSTAGVDYSGGWAGGPIRGPGTSGYELPDALFSGIDETIEIPSDWLVRQTDEGNVLLGTMEGGTFSPYVLRPNGSLDVLSRDELPVWTANPIISERIGALPRVDGLVSIPVQPLQMMAE